MLRRSTTALFAVGTLFVSGSVHADPLVPVPSAIAEWDGYDVALHPASLPGSASLGELPDSQWVGTATNFRTADPAFSCLNGSELEVYTASSNSVASPATLTFQLSDRDPDCLPDVTGLTWLAEPSLFLVHKAARMSKAADDGDDEGHAPRIDLWLTDGYGSYTPCTREVLSNNSKKYVCRTINYETTKIPTTSPSIITTIAVDYGEASGGGGYSLYTTDKRVYEGCDVRRDRWVCAAYATKISNKSFATSSKWYKNAYDKWADDTSYAVQCTAAIYNQDAQAIAEDCIPVNYLGWATGI